jgi:hypothetical protein
MEDGAQGMCAGVFSWGCGLDRVAEVKLKLLLS